MSAIETKVTGHYAGAGSPLVRVLDRLRDVGIDAHDLTEEMMSGIDQFHLGGRGATIRVLDDLGLAERTHVLDLGCGIGGPAQTMAATRNWKVLGADLTPEFVVAATELSALVNLAEATRFVVGDVTALDLEACSFGGATLFHVGMNLPDKAAVFREVARLLRPGGRFAVYDVMRTGPGEIAYPVPWGSDETSSFVESEEEYVEAIEQAGLSVERIENFAPLIPGFMATTNATPGLDLTVLMGEAFPAMLENVRGGMAGGTLAPIEIIAAAPR